MQLRKSAYESTTMIIEVPCQLQINVATGSSPPSHSYSCKGSLQTGQHLEPFLWLNSLRQIRCNMRKRTLKHMAQIM